MASLAEIAAAYRPSDNVEDRRRPFYPMLSSEGFLGSRLNPSQQLFDEQRDALSRNPDVAQWMQRDQRLGLSSAIAGKDVPKIPLGLSAQDGDAALREYVQDALDGILRRDQGF